MKKKILALMLTGLFLVGCSAKQEEKKEETKTAESTRKEESNKQTPKVEEKEGMKKTILYTNKNINITQKTDTINVKIPAVQVYKVEITNDTTAEYLELEKNKEYLMFTFSAEIENTVDKTKYFNLGNSEIVTNTKEQLRPNYAASEDIDGTFLGKVIKKGHYTYVLQNTKFEDLKNITLVFYGSSDEIARKGEQIKINIDLTK